MSEHLRLDAADGVATVTIDRPAKRNAMSHAMWTAIPALLAEVAADDSVRALVLRGGEHFSAGADIGEFATLRADAAGARRYGEAVLAASAAIAGLAKPTVAAITGYCIGGGCELALACDLRVAATDSAFGITPAKLGIVFPMPSTRQLVQLVGPAWAKQILYTADIIDAATALRIGLVNELHEPAELLGRARSLATTIASRSRVSVLGAKTVIARITQTAAGARAGHPADDSAEESLRELYDSSVASADYAEGVAAFLAKRPPRFTD